MLGTGPSITEERFAVFAITSGPRPQPFVYRSPTRSGDRVQTLLQQSVEPGHFCCGQRDTLAFGLGACDEAAAGGQAGALADDGLLDISILPAPQEVVSTLRDLLSGGLGIDNMFVRARLPWVEITVAEGLYINLDGEPLEGDHLRFEARPGALRVHLPADSPVLGASRRG